MAPKKDKGKKAEEAPKAGSGFTEVERTFLELQITECNRKIARLRAAVEEYETRNEELQKAYDKLDEDRADIISYLKKTLNAKNEENTELKDKVKGLEETREIETKEFKQTVAELERNFTVMKDQLSSENKLLASKLNTLEEFRAIRDDLMKKFEQQEQDFQDQEMKYKRIIYDAEKKYVVSKDKLKKEMEARLLQLAQDFQDATELRIAASTHRVIRENIAINNELDNMLSSQAKLTEQNEKYKEREKAARIAKELAEEERDAAINKNVIQLKVIEQLTSAFQDIKKNQSLQEKKVIDFETQLVKIQKLTKENENLQLQVRILEQNLHNKMSIHHKATIDANETYAQCEKLKKILKEAATVVRAALKLDEWAKTDPSKQIMDRQNLLSRLLDIVSQYRDIENAESIETIASMGQVYKEGDLGFIPKPVARKSLQSADLSTYMPKEVSRKAEHSLISISIDSSSLGSVKTMPSIKVMPPKCGADSVETISAVSFVTSSKSEVVSEESEFEAVTEADLKMTQMLEESKLQVQKSVMMELVEIKKSMGVLRKDDKCEIFERKSKIGFVDDPEEMETEQAELLEGEVVIKTEGYDSDEDHVEKTQEKTKDDHQEITEHKEEPKQEKSEDQVEQQEDKTDAEIE
ncbi:cilia- and flagella-associated protein 157-like [Plodia interpunctella]|uniref:cilia- and flagella-associated protein 157-like n=1 Tax=Plodia interpunctella TaxID=58824 RepID=UPI0023680F4F|nr:cilia- and flagella-associated protein 157-like [Plodia interpunctella]